MTCNYCNGRWKKTVAWRRPLPRTPYRSAPSLPVLSAQVGIGPNGLRKDSVQTALRLTMPTARAKTCSRTCSSVIKFVYLESDANGHYCTRDDREIPCFCIL